MISGLDASIDFIEELRLRRWARENYVPVSQRERGWHPIILEEMGRKDQESRSSEPTFVFASTER
jgi:hypothetical protein